MSNQESLELEIERLNGVVDMLLSDIRAAQDENQKAEAEMVVLRLRAEAATQWIPVSERLPKEGVTVSIWARGVYPDNRNEPGAWCNSQAFLYMGKWVHDFYTPAVEVSHWMLLPEPPAHDTGN